MSRFPRYPCKALLSSTIYPILVPLLRQPDWLSLAPSCVVVGSSFIDSPTNF